MSERAPVLATLESVITRVRLILAPLRRPMARRILKVLGLSLLIGGAIWSVTRLDLDTAQISPGLLVLNLLILSPLNLLLAALSLRISARALDRDIPLRSAVQTSAAANVAELLPLPGGAVVRYSALVSAGGGLGGSAMIITQTSLLTLALTIAVSATGLALMGFPAGAWLASVAVLAAAGLLAWMARHIHATLLVQMIAVRLATIGLATVRLFVSFAAIGLIIGLTEAAVYTIAPALGTTIAIVPGGFGVNEAIAAGIAALVAGSAPAAFLAVALNRALALTAGALVVAAFSLGGRRVQ